MELLANDLSLHGQFSDIGAFRQAIRDLMSLRAISRRYGREVRCRAVFVNSEVMTGVTLQHALSRFERDERHALLFWLTKSGPFWDVERRHDQDDYLECNGAVVTDTAIGEAGFCCLQGFRHDLVSMDPSDWLMSPLLVSLVLEDEIVEGIEVKNHWSPDTLRSALDGAPPTLLSWQDLAESAVNRFPQVSFSEAAFVSLKGHPFSVSAANRVLVLLGVLQELQGAYDELGKRTETGNRIYQDHFTGDKGWFSDSSALEKREFEKHLTFQHPLDPQKSLFCPWHGKVKTPQLRVHFFWPIRAGEPVLVPYVGPKLTKR